MTTPTTAAKPSRPPGRDGPRSIPRATYRIQLHRGFGFGDARRALPYLSELGVSHVYCSPYLMATPGSTHGYDVIDPTRLNPDLGTLSDYRDFCRALARHGLRQILDIVPNHMGVDTDANPWWQDVLRHGPDSAHARWFDIDWTRGRLLLPILGAPLAETIASGELALALDSGDAFRLRYYERSLPVNDAGAALIIARASRADDDGSLTEALADHGLVQAVADLQYYEPAHWRDASARINYRRFFDIAGLAALRIEDPAVFEGTHRTVIEWVRSGLVDGLRIDHPDGLRDPGAYFDRLQDAVRDHAGRRVYLVAEKILAPEEELPVDWPVDGTTGYDFANLLCGVLLDETTLPAIDAIWRAFTGEQTPTFGDLGRAAKREVLDASFVGDRAALARLFQAIDGSAPLAAIETVLTELVAAFPVYRAYPGSRHREDDGRAITTARDTALARLEPGLQPTLAAISDRLLEGLTGAAAHDEFVIRFQQLAAPVMAKGVEDTALYRWSRLVSVNDVGGDPDIHGIDVAAFHAANRRRAEGWPNAMLATSTHDNKRGEYVRMRINVISEDPAHWQTLVEGWRDAVDRLMNAASMTLRPNRGDLYLLFQTLVGSAPADPRQLPQAWRWPDPAAEAVADYAERIKAYMVKAGREAKRRTSWTEPDDAYEQAVTRAIELIFGSEPLTRQLLADIRPFTWWGGLNSLSASVLKLTVPGVPDIYQGARILDDSLVDPDNRRPVDFDERLPMIRDLAALAEADRDQQLAQVTGWLARGDFSRLKLWTIQRLLHWRSRHPALFEAGAYLPVTVTGRLARHLVAFVRRDEHSAILVVATRLYSRLGFAAHEYPPDSPPPSPWTDEALDLGSAGVTGTGWRDLLTATAPDPAALGGPQQALQHPIPVAALLAHLPVAVVRFDPGAVSGNGS
jgi:(1->4)-alpha-D-glucan 1-alpha-D-glucosylmutase